MKEIELTQGKVALVDEEDYNFLIQWKWYCIKINNYFYAGRNNNRKIIFMHRLLMNCESGDGKVVDHRDHNTLNNMKCNLRLATHSQNSANRMARGKSKFLGVYQNGGKYWTAQITNNGVQKYIGSFKSEYDAAIAYDKEAKRIHADFANLNFKLI